MFGPQTKTDIGFTVELHKVPPPHVSEVWEGVTTLMLDYGPSWNILHHFYHEMEHIDGSFAVRQQFFPDQPVTRMLFPGIECKASVFWHTLMDSTYPGNQKICEKEFGERRGCVKIESLVVSSRTSIQEHHSEVNQSGKMLMAHLTYIKPYMRTLRATVLQGVVGSNSLTRNKQWDYGTYQGTSLRVLIVERADDRDISTRTRDVFIQEMHRAGQFITETVSFEKLSIKDQMLRAQSADIFVGRHGNGLTHAHWLQPPAALVEVYAISGWRNDYMVVAELSGVRYIACEGSIEAVGQAHCFASSAYVGSTECPIRKPNKEALKEGKINAISLPGEMVSSVLNMLTARKWPPGFKCNR